MTTYDIMKQRAEAAEARVAELEAQNARLREALEEIKGKTETDNLLSAVRDIYSIAKAALADTKGAP